MRGKKAKKRPLQQDSIYSSLRVAKLIKQIMQDGKKSVAEGIVYGALGELDSDKEKALKIFDKALDNIMPNVEVRSRRIGGASYQVPVPVRQVRGEALAVRWLVDAAKSKKGRPMMERLSVELKEAVDNSGEAVRKKELTYKMAEANKAFSHFRW